MGSPASLSRRSNCRRNRTGHDCVGGVGSHQQHLGGGRGVAAVCERDRHRKSFAGAGDRGSQDQNGQGGFASARGTAKGTPRSPQYGHGRTRAVPSLPQVLVENGLREIAPLAKGERIMLERKRLDSFYQELQEPTRIEANTRTPQVKEYEEDAKSELTQS